ncbi:MAG: PD40 domain-containing protein [Lewinellaceae bacterium]|nr:PD40 domain-containing protein [Lewinellaceae bacterium]
MVQVVRNEIAGCNLAADLLEQQDTQTPRPSIAWLPPPIASTDNEFAPIPFSDTLLYFSQAREKQAVLMRCTKRKSAWQAPTEAFGLPPAAAQGFLCGSFSPDGQRFYFARSDAPPMAKQGSSVQKTNASLFALQRNSTGEWSEPIRLRPYINLEGSSNLWPFVCHIGVRRMAVFASDKAGGMGGLDLYACKRPLNADDFDFSFPLNLGRQVNTGGDGDALL